MPGRAVPRRASCRWRRPVAEQTEGTLTAAQATAGDPEILAAVAQRFDTQDVVLASATPQRLDGGKVKVDVVLAGIGPVGSLFSGTHSYAGDIGEPLDMVLRRAVEDIAKTRQRRLEEQQSLAVRPFRRPFRSWFL